jgi:hypothetical protein
MAVTTWVPGSITTTTINLKKKYFLNNYLTRKIFQLCPLWMAGEFLTRKFPTQSLLSARTHVGLHVKCLLFLSDLDRNWNVLIHFSETPQHQISWKRIQPFTCYMCTDGRTDFNRRPSWMRTRLKTVFITAIGNLKTKRIISNIKCFLCIYSSFI